MRTGHYTPCKWRCSASFQRVRLGNIKYDVGNIREVETARLPALVIAATDSATAAVLAELLKKQLKDVEHALALMHQMIARR